MRILALAGSLRSQSLNRRLLECLQTTAAKGVQVSIFDGLRDVPMFDEDLEQQTGGTGALAVVRLRDALAQADGLLIATPEYNQSLPGVVKNVVDWLSRTDVMTGKPTAILGATPGSWGTRYAQKELRHVLGALEALVMPTPAIYLASAAERLSEPATRDKLAGFLHAFVLWVRRVA